MMHSSTPLLLPLLALILHLAAHQCASYSIRYASPHATDGGGDCTARETPCSLHAAVAAASNLHEDHVVLLAGTFSVDTPILVHNKSLVVRSEGDGSHLACPERFVRLCSDADPVSLEQDPDDMPHPSSVRITMERCVESGDRDCAVFRVDPGYVNHFKVSGVSVHHAHRLVYARPLNDNDNPLIDNFVVLDCVHVMEVSTGVFHGRLRYDLHPDIIRPGTARVDATNILVTHANISLSRDPHLDPSGVFAMDHYSLRAQNVTFYKVNVSDDFSGSSNKIALIRQVPQGWKRVHEYRHVLSQVNIVRCTSTQALVSILNGNQGLLHWTGGTVSHNICSDTYIIGTSSDLEIIRVTFERNKLVPSDSKSAQVMYPLAMIRVLDARTEKWTFEGCTFRDNTAQVLVYSLALDTFSMEQCTVDGSFLTEYGCIHIINVDSAYILRSTITRCKNTVFGNSMENGGGAIFVEGTNLIGILYNTFQDNYAFGGSGGALYITKTCTTNLRSNSFKYNHVIVREGHGARVTLAMGGAVAITGSTTRCETARLIMDDSNIDQVTSFIGNNINGTAESRGGALYLSSLTLFASRTNLLSGIMESNYAAYGGAIYARDICYTQSKNHVSGLHCVKNHASVAGGCVFIEILPDVSIHKCESDQTDLLKFLTSDGEDMSDGYGVVKATNPIIFQLINSSIDFNPTIITEVGPDTRFSLQLGVYDLFDNRVEGRLTFVSSMAFNTSAEPNRQILLQSGGGGGSENSRNLIDVRNAQFQGTRIGTALKMTIASPTHPSTIAFERTFIVAPCRPGSQPIHDGTQCEPCAPGYHASAYGNGTCIMCPRGTRTELRGSAECELCPWWTITWLTWKGMASSSDCTLGSAMFLLAVFLASLFVALGILVFSVALAVFIRQVRLNFKQRKALHSLLKNDALEEMLLLDGANNRSGTAGLLDLREEALLRLVPWRYIIKKEDITIGALLASGSQASLFAGMYRGSAVALKLYRKRNVMGEDTNSKTEFIQEVRMLIALSNHPNVLQFFGICDFDSNKIAAVCELMKCSLAAHIERNNILHEGNDVMSISWTTKTHILKHIATGIYHLHQNNVCHRDIKPENILVGEDPAQTVKVADFGFSKSLNESRSMSSHTMGIGTAAYIAPELVNNENAVALQNGSTPIGRNSLSAAEQQLADRTLKACDVYSYGILIAALLLETTHPYGSMSSVDIVYQVKAQQLRPIVDEHVLFDRQLQFEETNNQFLNPSSLGQQLHSTIELMHCCWDQHPQRRPTFRDVISTLDDVIRN